jgi:hypothetical protein
MAIITKLALKVSADIGYLTKKAAFWQKVACVVFTSESSIRDK